MLSTFKAATLGTVVLPSCPQTIHCQAFIKNIQMFPLTLLKGIVLKFVRHERGFFKQKTFCTIARFYRIEVVKT